MTPAVSAPPDRLSLSIFCLLPLICILSRRCHPLQYYPRLTTAGFPSITTGRPSPHPLPAPPPVAPSSVSSPVRCLHRCRTDILHRSPFLQRPRSLLLRALQLIQRSLLSSIITCFDPSRKSDRSRHSVATRCRCRLIAGVLFDLPLRSSVVEEQNALTTSCHRILPPACTLHHCHMDTSGPRKSTHGVRFPSHLHRTWTAAIILSLPAPPYTRCCPPIPSIAPSP